MSHIAQPEHSSAALPSRSFLINIRDLFTRLGSSISCALNGVRSAIVSDRHPPTNSSASVAANISTNNSSASLIPLVTLPPPVYQYNGYFHNVSSTSFLPPYPGAGGPPRYGIDLEAGVPIRDNQRRRRYLITSGFLGGRSTLLPEVATWPFPESYKKLFLIIGCIVAIIGCIALAMLIPRMHKLCHPCKTAAYTR